MTHPHSTATHTHGTAATDPDGSAATHTVFARFVEQLGARPDRAELLDDLQRDHEPDSDGWCRHPVHEVVGGRPEAHPCTTTRLVTTIRRAVRDAAASPGTGPVTGADRAGTARAGPDRAVADRAVADGAGADRPGPDTRLERLLHDLDVAGDVHPVRRLRDG